MTKQIAREMLFHSAWAAAFISTLIADCITEEEGPSQIRNCMTKKGKGKRGVRWRPGGRIRKGLNDGR